MFDYDYELEQADLKIEMFGRLRLDMIKIAYESMGLDFGESKNLITYRNYMADEGLMMSAGIGFGEGCGFAGLSGGQRLPGGKLPIPDGFYSDLILYEFITNAEGAVGIQWVSSKAGHNVVRSAACFGYDFPGGVHDPSFIRILGLTESDADSMGVSNQGRAPSVAESYGGRVQWGWNTNPLPMTHPYWSKLIPVYRDKMIWAWNQSVIQSYSDPADRLARMHSINWLRHQDLSMVDGHDKGFPGRLRAAKKACGTS